MALEAQVQWPLATEGSRVGDLGEDLEGGYGFSGCVREAPQKRDKRTRYKFRMSQNATEYHA